MPLISTKYSTCICQNWWMQLGQIRIATLVGESHAYAMVECMT